MKHPVQEGSIQYFTSKWHVGLVHDFVRASFVQYVHVAKTFPSCCLDSSDAESDIGALSVRLDSLCCHHPLNVAYFCKICVVVLMIAVFSCRSLAYF